MPKGIKRTQAGRLRDRKAWLKWKRAEAKRIAAREWPCLEPDCTGEMKPISTSPSGITKFECTYCWATESYP